MTHPFHPLSGQRLRVLFERRLAAGLAVSCEGGPLGSLMLPLAWTDRGEVAADGPLTYEVLVSLAADLPDAGGFLAGSLVEQRRRCGKEGCRCARGELHGPYAYLSVAGRMIYVPATLAGAIRLRLEISARLRAVLEEISAVNLELLARRELD